MIKNKVEILFKLALTTLISLSAIALGVDHCENAQIYYSAATTNNTCTHKIFPGYPLPQCTGICNQIKAPYEIRCSGFSATRECQTAQKDRDVMYQGGMCSGFLCLCNLNGTWSPMSKLATDDDSCYAI